MNGNRKVAIITGGGQGIGKAISQKFLQTNINVVIAEIDREAGEEWEKDYGQDGLGRFIQCDVSEEKDVINLMRKTVQIFSGIDILINNAALGINKPLRELELFEWNRVIGVNLTGAFLCSKHASEYLKSGNGSILNIASTRAFMSEADTEAYSASKGGLFALTHALAVSMAPNVRVNCISPGWIETAEWQKAKNRNRPEHSEADRKQHPAGRVGIPQDVANLALFLISDNNSFITGANFIVDGGMTRKMIYA